MTNRLITADEAAKDLIKAIEATVEDCRAEGMTDREIESGLTEFFGAMGGFPREEVSNG